MEQNIVAVPLSQQLKDQVDLRLAQLGMTWADFVQEAISSYEPLSQETLVAMKESEAIMNNPSSATWYQDVDDFLTHLKS